MKSIFKILLFIVFSSCSSGRLINLGAQASKKGIEVAQKGIDTYNLLAKQKDIDQSQQDMILILTDPDPGNMPLPNFDSRDFSKQIEPRLKAYKSLLNVYQAFNLLSDSKYSKDTKTATGELITSYNNLKQLPNLSSNISGLISGASGKIMQGVQAGQVKKHNEILCALTKIYLELWNDELNSWDKYIDGIYDKYANQLKTVPAKYFDKAKVKAGNTEPYNDDTILLLMYRIKQRNIVLQQKQDLKQELLDFGKSLTQLTEAHAEISKDQANSADAITYLNNIETLLKAK